MRTAAAKRERVVCLAAVFFLALLIVVPSAEASRKLPGSLEPALTLAVPVAGVNDDLIRETTWDADPISTGDATKLAETSTTFTSFGAARLVEEVLEADKNGDPVSTRIIETKIVPGITISQHQTRKHIRNPNRTGPAAGHIARKPTHSPQHQLMRFATSPCAW